MRSLCNETRVITGSFRVRLPSLYQLWYTFVENYGTRVGADGIELTFVHEGGVPIPVNFVKIAGPIPWDFANYGGRFDRILQITGILGHPGCRLSPSLVPPDTGHGWTPALTYSYLLSPVQTTLVFLYMKSVKMMRRIIGLNLILPSGSFETPRRRTAN